MRGAVIGGEKGAMLPGAFIGLILAWFSGGGIRECFWIPAAAGLMGMTFGGIEPYGETIGMVDGEHDVVIEMWDDGKFVNPEEVIIW